jgi:hypothetical protein
MSVRFVLVRVPWKIFDERHNSVDAATHGSSTTVQSNCCGPRAAYESAMMAMSH